MKRHLRGRMDGHPRRASLRQEKKAHILHQHRIHRKGTGVLQQLPNAGNSSFSLQQRVQGKIYLYAARMTIVHGLFERLPVKILFALARR